MNAKEDRATKLEMGRAFLNSLLVDVDAAVKIVSELYSKFLLAWETPASQLNTLATRLDSFLVQLERALNVGLKNAEMALVNAAGTEDRGERFIDGLFAAFVSGEIIHLMNQLSNYSNPTQPAGVCQKLAGIFKRIQAELFGALPEEDYQQFCRERLIEIRNKLTERTTESQIAIWKDIRREVDATLSDALKTLARLHQHLEKQVIPSNERVAGMLTKE